MMRGPHEPSADLWLERLNGLPVAMAWAVVVIAGVILHRIDMAVPKVGMGPLYIPVIAFATWRLGLRAGFVTMALAGVVNAVPMVRNGDVGETGFLLARGLVRLSAYLFTTVIVGASRRAYDREKVRARCDALTGVANRRAFVTRLDAALGGMARHGRTMLVAVVDLDGFKAVNDDFGHDAGDRVLRDFATAATAAIRADDVFGRLGGDEFAFFIPVASPAEAREVALDLHVRLADAGRHLDHPVGISMGALIVPARAAPRALTALKQADGLLYDAKRAGKRTVRIGDLAAPPVRPPAAAPIPRARGCAATFSALPPGAPGFDRIDRRRRYDADPASRGWR